jgi:hypothetical protein
MSEQASESRLQNGSTVPWYGTPFSFKTNKDSSWERRLVTGLAQQLHLGLDM